MDEENGENIVISGVSGRFPMCQNVEEFSKNLYGKVDMVAEAEDGETDTLYSKIPKRRGIVDNLNKFDAACFHVNTKQANKMSPESRILLELATEAIFDAGINPASLRGTNTAVCLAQSTYDSMYTGLYSESSSDLLSFLGSSSVIAVNRVSFCLGLRGMSIVVDAACAASFVALHTTINWIRQGESDAALVLVTNVQSHPIITKMFANLNVLNPDGCSRPFDENANGYVRSDTIAAILLQKRRDAKRVYANIEDVICNHDGFKVKGITHPSSEGQSALFERLYKKVKIDPLNVHFVEAHGTGTIVGDPEECQAIDKVFCKNRKEPLLVGSTKSNMGHAEGASGIASIMKAIFTFETGLIPPNINFSKVRQDIPSLTSGRLKVCTEPTPLKGSFIAINVFGFGGVNGHALLRKEEKRIKTISDKNLPTLVCWSGRTEEAVRTIFAKLKSTPINVEFNALLHNIQNIPIKENLHRGYIVLKTSETSALPQCVEEKTSLYDEVKRPIVWASSGLGSQYPKMAQNLMRIPSFVNSIMKCHQVLKQFDLDLVSLITKDESAFDNIPHSFVGITAVQVALVDLLKSLEVRADFFVGHSMGEICCAYADGALTLEQTIMSSYYRGKCSVEEETIEGAMAAIGLGYNDIKDNLPPNIEVACHNSSRSCTISGPKNDILEYVDELRSKQIFAKTVKCGNIAFHAKYIANVAPKLLEKLKSVIPNKVERSSKWLSTSNTVDQWHTDLAKFASAEYFVNNYLSPVYFEETCKLLPENAIIIEIAPHRLMQSIFTKMLPNAIYVPLAFNQYGDQIEFLSMALGKLYMSGISFQIDRLYPAVDFPVSQGTPMISPLIKWNHEKDWPTSQNTSEEKVRQIQKTFYVNSSDDNFKFIDGHCIDGRCVIPAASILNFVKDAAIGAGAQAFWLKRQIQSLIFENVRFLSTIELTPNTDVKITISIQQANGKFVVCEGTTIRASGLIKCSNDPSPIRDVATFYKEIDLPILNSSDVYKEFRLRGCNYAGELKAIDKARMDGCYAQIKCKNNNWITIMDAMIQVTLLSKDTRSPQVPAEIRRVRINFNYHLNQFKSTDDINDDEKLLDVYHSSELSTVVCGGVEMNGVTFTPVERIQPEGIEVLQTYQFVPLMDAVLPYFSAAAGVCIELALEKIQRDKVTLVEVLSNESKPSIDCIYEFFRRRPLVFADLTLLHGDIDISLKNKESIRCESSSLEEYSDCTFIIMNKCTQNDKLTEVAKQSLSKDGFLIFIDDLHINITVPNGFTMISRIKCSEVIFTLMQRIQTDCNGNFEVIQIDSGDEHFKWLQKLQETNPFGNVLLVAQSDKTSGVLGLINCLRLELDTKDLRCIIIEDENAPPFDVNASLYKKQLALQLPVNIYRDAKWGTYRHLDLKPNPVSYESEKRMTVNVEQCDGQHALHWVQHTELSPSNQTVRVQYAALNFCDRLIASGSLPNHTVIKNRLDEYRPLLGFECAGVTENQKRVMCFALSGGLLSTHMCYANADILLEVPANMSLRDAATIPFAYFTVYSSFFLKNGIESGQSILINSDCRFASLAAIHVALAYGLVVFAAVSTQQKKEFLLNNFPQLKERNVGSFSDYSFEELVMNETNYKGTDFVLNSLPDDEQQASIRCLKRGGTFLQLGRFDVDKSSEFAMNALRNGVNIQPIVIEHVIKNLHERNKVIALMEKDLKCGTVQPLPSTIFEADDIENAFKFLMNGDHVGKVLVQIRREENSGCYLLPLTLWPRALFKPELVYILIGGLGGFGLELADWMIMRGARNLVLCSRRGLSDQYQKSRIKKWESYGCTIVINSSNVTTGNGCEELLSTSTDYGEIGGIFNLAVVLRDGILANQTASKLSESFAPKVWATVHLDNLSRTMCPKLEYFVVFSSFASGYGNPGQSNYAMANSIMEKCIEQRRRCNLPGKAIQWSAIGDVGMVTNLHNDNIRVDLRGTLPMRMDSCLLALDKLLTHSEPIVACMQVAIEKQTTNKSDVMESICQILCVDQKSIELNASLTHIGMDSLMAVEVRQMLQREFNIVLDNNAIKNVSIEELNSIFNRIN